VDNGNCRCRICEVIPVKTFPAFAQGEIPETALSDARIVVLPIPYENAPSYGSGSQTGPGHILTASEQLEGLDEESLFDLSSLKLNTQSPLIPNQNPEAMMGQIEESAYSVLRQNKTLLCLGGDHSVSIGAIRGAEKCHPNLGVLQIDAHMDLREEWNGSRYNHACVMRRVTEAGAMAVVQVGTRAFSAEEANVARAGDFTTFFSHNIEPADKTWMDRVADALPDTVYLTLDLDGLDPSVIPGTGTPEPGGLSYRQVVELIKTVGRKRHIIAADIVELVKIEGTQVSEYTAAKIAAKILVYGFSSQTPE
jgi:agmatinase